MNELITLIGLVLNFIMFIYIIYTIPSRVKKNGAKLDTATNNQTILEKKINSLK
jgi:hypothetical protein